LDPQTQAQPSAAPQPVLRDASPPAPPPSVTATLSCPGVDAAPPRALDAPASPPADARCRSFPRRLTRKIAKAARDEWTLSARRSTLEVTFACDAFGDDLGELIFERSWGHGFSLGLYRVRPQDEHTYEVTWLRYGPYGTPVDHDPDHPAGPWELAARNGATVQTALIGADRVEPALLQLRALMQLQLREVQPPPSDADGSSLRLSGSTTDFHTAYRFVDSAGLGQQDFWAGYQRSDEQEQWVPLALAERVFADVVHADDVVFVERVPTAADREFFAERFATARDRGDDFGFWYVRERTLSMARTLGDPPLVPDLLRVLVLPPGPSEDRSRALAIDVLNPLMGRELRYDPDGTPRSVDEAVVELRSACEPS
ncbi:MAG: hypothetical protein KUG77_07225, partial [Nannocystaceae bacterium]|nr:hypothetical protein [Nannocystaceae bacterium]